MSSAAGPDARRRVVLGVSGGIAAYKAASLLRLLTESGHDVTVVPTAAALRFVGEPTWAALSGHPVATDVWDDVDQVPHVRLGQQADLVVVAPATADLLARAAHGMADDLLTSTLLTARCPVLMAPAMHTEMWQHPATRANVATLRARGVVVLDPGQPAGRGGAEQQRHPVASSQQHAGPPHHRGGAVAAADQDACGTGRRRGEGPSSRDEGIEDFLGGDTSRAALMVGYFGTVWAVMQFFAMPVMGALSDRFGRRPVILLSNLGLGLDYVLMAVSYTHLTLPTSDLV